MFHYMAQDIALQRQIIRNHHINEVIEILKSIRKKHRDLDIKKFISELCFRYGCSKRTAKEYYDLAFHKLANPYDEFKFGRRKK